jgi:nucleotide-binding universal stress UspA family protein
METDYVIVVGVDGSAASRRALRWAVREVASRGGAVKAVTVWHPTEKTTDLEAVHARHAEIVRAEVAAVQEEEPSAVTIAAEAIQGRPAEVLAAVACEASLLVIGGHGSSRAWHQLMGSTAEECIRLAQCPVVVIPEPHDQRQ